MTDRKVERGEGRGGIDEDGGRGGGVRVEDEEGTGRRRSEARCSSERREDLERRERARRRAKRACLRSREVVEEEVEERGRGVLGSRRGALDVRRSSLWQ